MDLLTLSSSPRAGDETCFAARTCTVRPTRSAPPTSPSATPTSKSCASSSASTRASRASSSGTFGQRWQCRARTRSSSWSLSRVLSVRRRRSPHSLLVAAPDVGFVQILLNPPRSTSRFSASPAAQVRPLPSFSVSSRGLFADLAHACPPQALRTLSRSLPTCARRPHSAAQQQLASASSGPFTTPVRPFLASLSGTYLMSLSSCLARSTLSLSQTEQAGWIEETLAEARACAARAHLPLAVHLYVTRPQLDDALPTLTSSGSSSPSAAASPSLADSDDEKKLDLSPAGSSGALGSSNRAAALCTRFSGRPNVAHEVAKTVRESSGRTLVVGALLLPPPLRLSSDYGRLVSSSCSLRPGSTRRGRASRRQGLRALAARVRDRQVRLVALSVVVAALSDLEGRA